MQKTLQRNQRTAKDKGVDLLSRNPKRKRKAWRKEEENNQPRPEEKGKGKGRDMNKSRRQREGQRQRQRQTDFIQRHSQSQAQRQRGHTRKEQGKPKARGNTNTKLDKHKIITLHMSYGVSGLTSTSHVSSCFQKGNMKRAVWGSTMRESRCTPRRSTAVQRNFKHIMKEGKCT